MERTMTHVGDGGGDGSSGGSAASTVSREELAVVVAVEEDQSSDSNVGVSSDEVSSYPEEDELELGLGLSLSVGGGDKQHGPRILIAKDLPSMCLRALKASPSSAASSSSSSPGGGGRCNSHGSCAVGTKRAAETYPTGVCTQVVGWPPIRAYRVNSMANQAKSVATGELNSNIGESKGTGVICRTGDKGKDNHNDSGHLRGSLLVKVNMDGVGIGRKVDLNAHSSYESLAQTLEDMFTIPTISDTLGSNTGEYGVMPKAKSPSRLLDELSDLVITYEDRDGDWMLVGDVPWRLFLSSVKRLRIMKRSEANGLETRIEERTCEQRSDPYRQRSRPM